MSSLQEFRDQVDSGSETDSESSHDWEDKKTDLKAESLTVEETYNVQDEAYDAVSDEPESDYQPEEDEIDLKDEEEEQKFWKIPPNDYLV